MLPFNSRSILVGVSVNTLSVNEECLSLVERTTVMDGSAVSLLTYYNFIFSILFFVQSKGNINSTIVITTW